MTGFNASYLEIEPRELVRHLLRETGQFERDAVNPADLLKFLNLDYITFDFDSELPADAKESVGGAQPRALISFDDRVVATHDSLGDNRMRFSVLHEIGHYVLPSHVHALWVCDERGLSSSPRLVLEKEASEFAADLLFLGDRFSVEANNLPISAATVKALATKYQASFEATARRLVGKNFKPCMLVAFKKDATAAQIDTDRTPTWSVRYCVASPRFKTRFFESVSGQVPQEIVAAVTTPGRDIADSIPYEMAVDGPGREPSSVFNAAFFWNTFNIFCLLTPQ